MANSGRLLPGTFALRLSTSTTSSHMFIADAAEHNSSAIRLVMYANPRVENRDADLVIDNDVDRAADGVVRQRAHVKRLVHDALSREAAVAVQQDAHRPQPLLVVAVVLLCPNLRPLTLIRCGVAVLRFRGHPALGFKLGVPDLTGKRDGRGRVKVRGSTCCCCESGLRSTTSLLMPGSC